MNVNRVTKLLAVAFVVVVALSLDAHAQLTPATQVTALKDLYLETNGPLWRMNSGWNTKMTADPCVEGWYGVICNGYDVIVLNLEENDLLGVIPNTLQNLVNLTTLQLWGNQLTGKIPDIVIEPLQVYDLHDNLLIGSIPESIGENVNLVHFDVSQNGLSGAVPSSIGNLLSLNYFGIEFNRLEGPINIGGLDQLQQVIVSNNILTGNLLEQIANKTLLQIVNADNNSFTGPFPETFGSQLPNLQILIAPNNSFTGPIPETIGQMTQLQQFIFAYNNITSTIPSSIGELKQLQQIAFSLYPTFYDPGRMGLYGTIPEELGTLPNLMSIDFSTNSLSGTLPKSLVTLEKLQILNLEYNMIGGPFYEAICELPGFQLPSSRITLHMNRFNGTLASACCSVESFDYYYNEWECPLPTNCPYNIRCNYGY